VHRPRGGDHLIAGSVTEVTWDVDPDAQAVTIMSSFDDGTTWNLEAESAPNTGSFQWSVPSVSTDVARVQVITIYAPDPDGTVNQGEYAASDAFSIGVPTGVAPGVATFSLRPSNPSVGGLDVSFSLASDSPATLAVYDVSGRQVVSRDVGSSGPGWHAMKLGNLRAGVYIVRLSQGGRNLSSRVAILR
jgi:hypothetical protein